MATALIYVLVLLAVAAAIFVGVSTLFGRGEELAPIPRGASPTWLPDSGMAAADVRAVRFQQAVRGYRMAEVDWVLDRVAGELDRLHRRIAELEPPGAELTADEPSVDEPTADEPSMDGPPADEPCTDEPPADQQTTSASTEEHTQA